MRLESVYDTIIYLIKDLLFIFLSNKIMLFLPYLKKKIILVILIKIKINENLSGQRHKIFLRIY